MDTKHKNLFASSPLLTKDDLICKSVKLCKKEDDSCHHSFPNLSANYSNNQYESSKGKPFLGINTKNSDHNVFKIGSQSRIRQAISIDFHPFAGDGTFKKSANFDNQVPEDDDGFLKDEVMSEDDLSSFFKYYRQIFSVMVTSTLMLLSGMVIGWSTVIPKMQADSSVNMNLTDTDVKWIISCAWLAEIPANLIAGSIMEWLGPRKVLFLLQIPAAISWLLLAYVPSIPVLYLCRISLGLVQGIADTVVQPLVAELSEPGIRGALLVLPSINTACGVLIVYLLGNFCHWQTATALCATPAIVTFILGPLVPESSYWLMRHDKRDEARSSLEQLVGSSRTNRVREMLSEIETSVRDQPVSTFREQIRLVRLPQYWRPLILLIFIFIARETGGQSIVFSYTVYLFKASGVALDAFTCTILVGVVRLVSTIVGSLLMDCGGRRPLLISTMIICSVALATAGIAIVTGSGSEWVPLSAVLVFAAGYSAGVNPVPWALQGELLPTPIRALGSSLTTVCYSLSVFGVTNIFPELLEKIGLGYSFILFSICLAVTTVFIFCFIPETRGRSLLELEKAFVKEFDDEPETPQIGEECDAPYKGLERAV